jgi:hypothetical protein
VAFGGWTDVAGGAVGVAGGWWAESPQFGTLFGLADRPIPVTLARGTVAAGGPAGTGRAFTGGPLTTAGSGHATAEAGRRTIVGPSILNAAAGLAALANGGGTTVTFHGDMVHNGPEIRTPAGARMVFLGTQSGAGGFTGPGTVEYRGQVRPGNSPAIVFYGGDVVLGSTATLVMELAGTDNSDPQNPEYDRLVVAGRLEFGGTLTVEYIAPFTAQRGDSFLLFDAGTLAGTFNQINLPAVASGDTWSLGRLYTEGVISVVPVPEPAFVTGVFAAGLAGWHAWRRTRFESGPVRAT